jgi:hypothetical protein
MIEIVLMYLFYNWPFTTFAIVTIALGFRMAFLKEYRERKANNSKD